MELKLILPNFQLPTTKLNVQAIIDGGTPCIYFNLDGASMERTKNKVLSRIA